jgi:fructose-1,6-bisphosphatase I
MDMPRIGEDLEDFLRAGTPADLARVLRAIAKVARPLAHRIRRGRLAKLQAADGSGQDSVVPMTLDMIALDMIAQVAFSNGLKGAGVRAVLTEKRADALALDPAGTLLVAISALDGASNIDANIPVGAFFSVLDAPAGELANGHFLQAGVKQRAAGLLIYGPQAAFVLTSGAGVHIATLDPDSNTFRISEIGLRIPDGVSEFAIDAANARHWPEPVRAYVEDCLEGADGPRGRNFDMRWVASSVADVYRILVSGGVCLYPGDSRDGHTHGRPRLLTEANPIAFLIEQAGGAAIDGFDRVLEIAPTAVAMRTPLIFGSSEKVERIARYFSEGGVLADNSPLFATRGLLRR